MKLREAVEQYILWRTTHGAKFNTGAKVLRRFCSPVDSAADCDSVTRATVDAFLAGDGRLTSTRANKYGALKGFYHFAMVRGYAQSSPLPPADAEPRAPEPLPPYVYSKSEVRRLIRAVEARQSGRSKLDNDSFRTLLVLLYASAMRIGEALQLTVKDVDLNGSLITVRDAKFYKSRLLPVTEQLAEVLDRYMRIRLRRPMPMEATFLSDCDGAAFTYKTVSHAFARLLRETGIESRDGVRRQPNLHSLRHASAVHRVTDWHRQGADVERLLPALSACLGHADLNGTQVYLSMTPELLHEASVRYDRYVNGGRDE